jgi:hypothetical protein
MCVTPESTNQQLPSAESAKGEITPNATTRKGWWADGWLAGWLVIGAGCWLIHKMNHGGNDR